MPQGKNVCFDAEWVGQVQRFLFLIKKGEPHIGYLDTSASALLTCIAGGSTALACQTRPGSPTCLLYATHPFVLFDFDSLLATNGEFFDISNVVG